MAPTRRQLLQGAAGLAGLGVTGLPALGAGIGRDLIVVGAFGGWDITYGIDPKLGLAGIDGPELDRDPDDADDVETVATFGGLDVVVNPVRRPALTSFFERWASQTVLVRGLWVGSLSHDAGRVRVLTGSSSASRPDLGAMVGAAHGGSVPLPYLDLAGAGHAGELAALMGQAGQNNQLQHLLDRPLRHRLRPNGTPYPLYEADEPSRGAIDAWLAGRREAQAASWAGRAGARSRLDDAEAARVRAGQLRAEGRSLADALGRAAGQKLAGRAQLAVDVLVAGLSRAVLVDSGVSWDTHDGNVDQHAHHQALFTGLDALLTRLDEEGRLGTTTVVVLSEMSRTPRRNDSAGKDHWPVTGAMVLGGSIMGGRVIGATTDKLDAVPIDLTTGRPDAGGAPLRYDQFMKGLLALLDADPEAWFPGLAPLAALTR